MHKGDAAEARKWLAALPSKSVEARWTQLRAQSAVRLAEGDFVTATEQAGAALELLWQQQSTGFTKYEESLLRRVLEAAGQQRCAFPAQGN